MGKCWDDEKNGYEDGIFLNILINKAGETDCSREVKNVGHALTKPTDKTPEPVHPVADPSLWGFRILNYF